MSAQEQLTYLAHTPQMDGLSVFRAKGYVHNFPSHTHDTFNITVICNNIFGTRLEDAYFNGGRGSLSITYGDEVRAAICDGVIGNDFNTFYISTDFIKYVNNGEIPFFTERVIDNPQLFDLFYRLSYSLSQDILYEKEFKKALEQLFFLHATSKERRIKRPSFFKEYLEDMGKHHSFSLENAASTFGINKYKFIRLFKQETGFTPNVYFINERIKQSKVLLKQGMPIRDVAFKTGFYDYSHFNRHFKSFTGVAPSIYQRTFLG